MAFSNPGIQAEVVNTSDRLANLCFPTNIGSLPCPDKQDLPSTIGDVIPYRTLAAKPTSRNLHNKPAVTMAAAAVADSSKWRSDNTSAKL